jgi:nitrogen regulatory protein PII
MESNMTLQKRKLVTIVTEEIIESLLMPDLKKLGAHGYTVTEARGEGARGVRSADWGHSQNIRIEVICDSNTAETIVDYLKQNYYQNYAMIVFVHDVEVTRPDKF